MRHVIDWIHEKDGDAAAGKPGLSSAAPPFVTDGDSWLAAALLLGPEALEAAQVEKVSKLRMCSPLRLVGTPTSPAYRNRV